MILEFMNNAYLTLKVVHLFAAFAWMAGLFYLPRLYVYHATVAPGSEASEVFKVMERKLLDYIMTPAMIVTLVLGLWLTFGARVVDASVEKWIWIKIAFSFGLLLLHGFLTKWRRDFAADRNMHSSKFYRFINEIPTLLLLGILVMVIIRPF